MSNNYKQSDKDLLDKAYEEGNPLVTDAEYDLLFGINATSEYIDKKSNWNKFKHTYAGCGFSLTKTDMFNKDRNVIYC